MIIFARYLRDAQHLILGISTITIFSYFLFIISFFTLGMITGVIHLVTLVYRSLFGGESHSYQEQTV